MIKTGEEQSAKIAINSHFRGMQRCYANKNYFGSSSFMSSILK